MSVYQISPYAKLTPCRPRAFQPTSHLPNRCSQCAARFAAGKKGKDRLQQHLDWHFRRNRKERESEARGRGANRRWLPRVEVSRICCRLRRMLIPLRPGQTTSPKHSPASEMKMSMLDPLRRAWPRALPPLLSRNNVSTRSSSRNGSSFQPKKKPAGGNEGVLSVKRSLSMSLCRMRRNGCGGIASKSRIA